MKVVIYTSVVRSMMDEYLIRQLIMERPQHEYILVMVDHKRSLPTLWTRIKRRLVELRDGPNHWLREMERLDRKIRKTLVPFDQSRFVSYRVAKVNDQQSQEQIRRSAPDIIVQAGAGILKQEIFSLAKIATLNVHHGFAPEVRGMRSTFWCLYYGLVDIIGVTCHRIDAGLDTGEVMLQERYAYVPGDDYVTIQHRLCRTGAQLLIRSIDLLSTTHAGTGRSEVDSYYFSDLTAEQFNALHRNSYRPVSDLSAQKSRKRAKLVARWA